MYPFVKSSENCIVKALCFSRIGELLRTIILTDLFSRMFGHYLCHEHKNLCDCNILHFSASRAHVLRIFAQKREFSAKTLILI